MNSGASESVPMKCLSDFAFYFVLICLGGLLFADLGVVVYEDLLFDLLNGVLGY